MSSFLFTTSVTLLLLSTLSFSTAYLVDIDGDPIRNGGEYYIVQGLTSNSRGLTYTQKNKNKECPLYITEETAENSPGTPVTISSPFRTLYISLGEGVSFTFQGPTPCGDSLEWGTTIDAWSRKLYITAGSESSAVAAYPFSITKRDRTLLPTYELMYGIGPTSFVGFFEGDGLLGLTQYPTTVSFKKASDVLKLPTS